MAVLVMPYLNEGVSCNGVAITQNPFRAALKGYFVNVQQGNVKVTDNAGGRTEQVCACATVFSL